MVTFLQLIGKFRGNMTLSKRQNVELTIIIGLKYSFITFVSK